MTSPERPDEGHIADTGMFRRFVDQEQELQDKATTGSRRWAFIALAAALVVVAVVVIWLLVR